MAETIATLGIKVTSDGVDKTEKALDKLSTTSTKSEKAIDRMIESIKKQNMILNSGKAAYTEYAMTALGASKAEQKLATDIIKATESIKASRKTASDQLKKNIAETKAGNKEQVKSIKDIENAENKRISAIQGIISAIDKSNKSLKMSKDEQDKYNLSLLGASDAEKKLANDIIDNSNKIKSIRENESKQLKDNIAETKAGNKEQIKAMKDIEKAESKRAASISGIISALDKSNKALKMTKEEQAKYNLSLLGASKAEKELANDIIKNTSKIQETRKNESEQLKRNIATTKESNREHIKAIKEVEKAEKKRVASIDSIIASLEDEEKSLRMSRHEQAEYNLALLGASKAEKEAAKQITDRIKAIKAAKKAEDESIRAIKASKIAKDKLIGAEKKRRDAVNTTIMKLRDEVAVLGKSESELLKYKMTLAGATAAEKKEALALQKTIAEFKAANQAANKHESALAGLTKRIIALGSVYGALTVIRDFGKSLIETAVMADSYKYSLQAVSDTNEEAAESYQYLKDESERLGLSITGQADSFTGFAASAKAAKLTVDETRMSYTGLNEAMTAMHRTPEQMAAGLMALEQMLGKGVVQSEELKRQLANALPGAVPMFADALGLSVSALKDLMKNGLVPAKEAVMIFTDYMSYKFADKAEDASNSVQASFNKMYNSLYELREAIVKAIGDEGTGILSNFTEEVKSMTEALSSPENQKAMGDMARGLSSIAKAAIEVGQALAWVADTTLSPLFTMQQGLDLIDKGMIDSQTFFRSTQEERIELIRGVTHAQGEYIDKAYGTAKAEKTITEAQVEANKVSFANIILKKEEEKRLTKIAKALDKLIKKTKERLVVSEVGEAEGIRLKALSLGATEKQAKALYDEIAAIEANKQAKKDIAKSLKEIDKAEAKRQVTIDKVIQKLKDEIATYKKGSEATSEYVLEQNKATQAEIAQAKALGETLDNLKAKTAAQKEYNKTMAIVAPDKVEIKREDAIIAANKALETGVILNNEYAESIKQINKYFDELSETAADKRLNDISKELDKLTSFDGSTFGNTMADGINNAVTSMNNLMKVYDKNEKAQKKIADLQKELSTGKGSTEERADKLKDIDKYETAMIKNQISGYRELFGTTSQLFDENSRERKALHNAEMAFAAVEIAMNTTKAVSLGVVAVINAMSAGDPYTAVARGLAVAATVAAALAQIGGSFSMGGGGGVSEAPPRMTSTTGTVLGDITAESESVSKTMELLDDIHASEYSELRAINDGIQDLNKNITGLVSGIVRSFGDFSAESLGVAVGDVQSKFIDAWDKLDVMDKAFESDIFQISAKIDPGLFLGTEFAGGIAESIIGGFFGKTSTKLTEAGFEIGENVVGDLLDGVDVAIQQYQTIKIKKKSWFGSSKKYKTMFEDVNAEIQDFFNDVFVSAGQSMVALEKSLGTDNLETIKEHKIDPIRINLKDKTGEEITKEMNAVISTMMDELSNEFFGELIEQYQELDEGMFETVSRLAVEKEIALSILEKTNQAFAGSTIEAVHFSQVLLDMAGGIEKLSESFSTYYDKFFTDAEKQADIFENLTGSLAGIDVELPGTRELYRGLVEGLDLTTKSGQKAYVTLLELSETSDEYYSYLEDAEEDRLELAKKAEEDRLELAKKRTSLEIQIMKLEGKTAEALAMSRRVELDAMDESLRPLQERIYALNDLSAAERKAADYLAAAESKAATAKSAYLSGLKAEINILEGNFKTAKSTYLNMLKAESDEQKKLVDSLGSAIKTIKEYRASLFGISDSPSLKAEKLRSKQVGLARQVSIGDTGSVSELISVSGQYLDVARDTSKTSLDYAREVAKTNALMFGVQENLGDQLTEAEQQLISFDNLISEVEGIDGSIKTIGQAQAEYESAKTELDNNWYADEILALEGISLSIESLRDVYLSAEIKKTEAVGGMASSIENKWAAQTATTGGIIAGESGLTVNENIAAFAKNATAGDWVDMAAHMGTSEEVLRKIVRDAGIPGFASGGFNPGGLSIVGERGPELSYRPPSQIMSNSDMMGALSNREVVAELKQLRKELARANFAIAKNTQNTAKTTKKWDNDGMPAVRDDVAA